MSHVEQPEGQDRTEIVNPIANTLSRMLEAKAAQPRDVYRLALIVEKLLDSLDSPAALQAVRGELRALLNDLAQGMNS
jgi:hypothetical protein